MKTYKLFTDGGARGNPGPAGIGFCLLDKDNEILADNNFINTTTNNVAEYTALLTALQAIRDQNLSSGKLQCYLDSQLVVMQVLGKYKVKQPHLQTLVQQVHQEINSLEKKGWNISIQHIPRNQNKRADQLVNEAIDKATS